MKPYIGYLALYLIYILVILRFGRKFENEQKEDEEFEVPIGFIVIENFYLLLLAVFSSYFLK